MSLLAMIAVVGTLGCCAYYALALFAAARFRRRPLPRAAQLPPVSLLKPLRGADPQAEACLRSHIEQDYPEFEIIFGVSDPEDPALPIVRRLIAEHPQRSLTLVVCEQILGPNRKVSKLAQMLPHALHAHFIVTDADIRVPPDHLRRVMAHFADAGVGMVTAPYRGVPAATLGSRLESLGISTDFLPGVLAAWQLEGGLRFALGSTLAFPRAALEAAGGLAPLLDYLADDYELGRRIAGAGHRVELSDCVVETHLPAYPVEEYVAHQLRWARTVRDARPGGYLGLLFTFGLPWGLLAWWSAPLHAQWGLLLFAGVAALRLGVAVAVGRGVAGDACVLRDLWLLPLRDAVHFVIWLASFFGHTIVWRGERFRLSRGRLIPLA